MSSSNYNAVSSQAASESTPAIPLMMSSMGTTFAPITTVGSIGMIPIMSTPTPTPTTTMFPGSITTPGGAFTPYPSAGAQFAADPANAQALQGYQLVMAMMQQVGRFMPFAYPGMTPPIMPPLVSTPSTFVPRMVPIHPVNLMGTMNEAAPSNVHEIDEAEQEAARRRKGKAIAKPSKTRDSAFQRLGDKEDGPRKSAKLRLGPEMGWTSAMERLGGNRHAQSRRSREFETIHQDEEEAESQPRASAYTRLSYDEGDLDKIGSVARVHAQRLRRKIKLDVEKFTGKEDPNVHLDTFHNAAQMAGCTDAEECLLFFSSLRGRPVEWFNGLPHGRIGIKSDSSLVVGHINGNMEAKGEKMQKYRDLAKALLKDLAEYVMEQIPRGENTDADLLSKLTQAAPEHVSKLARIEMLEKASIEGLSVSLIEEDGQPNPDRVEPDDIWMDDLVRYYMTGQFPENEDRVRKVKLRAPRFQMLERRIYKRAFGGPLLRCLTRAEAERVIAEVHEGVCAAHQMSRTLAQRIILLGYFWPTMNQDCERYVQRCKICQVFYKFPGRPATYYHPVSNVIPFARFGMDIIGDFPQAQGRKKYVMVAIDYFTKWVEAEAYATITTKQCQRFVWKNIITRFGSPRNIVTDNGPQFRNPGFTKYLEDFGITHNKAFVAYPQGNGRWRMRTAQ
ncbi:unnamed protein product [Cuscuta campestris]|uniref:Integrase catalytic domain-containing protein n=1 Tax=Cuscuta campestris TaxID=132261 RepID=A0A484N930_9ASTE|nr:unnamed protein product [Cuscuta campestris]